MRLAKPARLIGWLRETTSPWRRGGKKSRRAKTRLLPRFPWSSEALEGSRDCTTVAACSIPREKIAGALRWFCFPALGKKVFVKNHASYATVEKCPPF